MTKKIIDRGINEVEDEIYSLQLIYKLYFGMSIVLVIACLIKIFIENITILDSTIIVVVGFLNIIPIMLRKYIFKMIIKVRLDKHSSE